MIYTSPGTTYLFSKLEINLILSSFLNKVSIVVSTSFKLIVSPKLFIKPVIKVFKVLLKSSSAGKVLVVIELDIDLI